MTSFKMLDRACRLIRHRVHRKPSTLSLGLYGDLMGVARAVQHCRKRFGYTRNDDLVDYVDDYLVDALSCRRWPAFYDLISGLVGFGVYALEGYPGKKSKRIISLCLRHLERASLRTPQGICWHTPVGLIPVHQRLIVDSSGKQALRRLGYYNTGVAHGSLGVVGFLSQVYSMGIEKRTTRALILGSARWLRAQSLASRPRTGLPRWYSEEERGPAATRPAWCYGDAGYAITMLIAGSVLRDRRLVSEGLRAAKRVNRPEDTSAVYPDAGLCHGTAGLGQIFSRLHQSTGQRWLQREAEFWARETLSRHVPAKKQRGYGGYMAFSPLLSRETWIDDPGFLTGTVGVGLFLLSFFDPDQYDWDRVLLTCPDLL